jgi:hypothetical protein
MAERTENTVCGSASMCSSPSAVAGASRLISMGSPRVLLRVGRGHLIAAQHDQQPYRSVEDEA